MDHKEETKIVKTALKQAGIDARVKHGRGTGYGWLEVHLDYKPTLEHDRDKYGWDHCAGNCERCRDYRETMSRIISITQSVTGRNGDYSGRINVHM